MKRGSAHYWQPRPRETYGTSFPAATPWSRWGRAHRPPCCSFRALALSLRRDQSPRSEEHTSELQSLMRISYAVFCLKKHITFLKASQSFMNSLLVIFKHAYLFATMIIYIVSNQFRTCCGLFMLNYM